MAKALKTVAVVAGIAALAIVTGGAAVGLGVSLATSVAGVSASSLLLASTALSTTAALLTKKPSVTSAQTDRLFANVTPRAFRKTPLGSTALPVDVRYEEWSGRDQEYCDWIVQHASCAIEAADEIWFDTELAWTASAGAIGKYRGYFSVPNLILEGTTANAFTFGAGKWNAASARLVGCAYARWRFKVTGNSKKAESPFASGLPGRITVIGRGAKLYDPRRDSTVPGGSGPMRADDQSTWRFTADDGVVIGDNLPLQILRVVLGWRIRNPMTGAMLLATGSGVPPRRLRLQSWITSANIADELVNRSAGGQEPRYHGAAVVSEGDDTKQTLDMLCAGCCGRFRDTQGKLALDIAHNDLAAIATDEGLLDDDVIGGFTWDPDPGFDGIPNVIRGQYVDATTGSLYQLLDYPEVRIASPDGVDRVRTVDLGAVESPSQAQRIVKQILQRALFNRKFTAPFDIRAWKYPVGSVLPFTFAPLGFVRVPFRVEAQELGQDGVCNMTLSFEHPAIYAWDRDDAPAVIAADPIVYDASKNPLIQAIADAGETGVWGKIADPDGKKPDDNADVTGENTAKDTASIGGRPTPVVLEKVDKIEPMLGELAATKGVTEAQGRALEALRAESNAAFDLFDQDGLVKAEALRSIDDELQRLGHIALSSLLDQEDTRRILRDAGVSVDPASGKATIWAIEQLKDQTRKVELTIDAQAAEIRQKVTVDRVEEMILLAQLDPSQLAELEPLIRRVTSVEQVASGLLASLSAKAEAAELTRTTARLTTVSQELDALAGTVDTKASRLDVDAQGVRLTQIGQQLAAMPDGARLSVELTQVRTEAAAGQLATLDALLAGEAAADRRIAEMAQYRQEVITRIDAGLAVEVAERRSLAATMGGIDVRLSAELRGLVTAAGGTARQVAALEVASQQQTAQIGDLRDASIDAKGGIAGLQTTVRQMGPRADAAELAVLDGMLDAEERGVDAQRQLAQVQLEMTTRFITGERSAAATKLLLEARIGANDSRIGQTAEAVATLDRSTASRMDAIDVRVGRLSDDTAASQAIVTRDLAALVEKDRAIVADIATLSTEVRDPDTGLSKTRADLLREIELSATDRASLARSYEALAAVVNDPTTGLERTRAQLQAEIELSATDREALARDARTLAAEVRDPDTGLTKTRSQMLAEVELSASDRAALARKYDALQAIVVDPASGNPYWVGSIADLRKIVIDGDKLIAERVDTVEGTVGGNSASIAFLRRVVDGKEAIAQLAVTAAGKVTGFRIDGQERVFAIAADRFIIGDRQIFEIDTTTGVTRMLDIEVNRVRAGSIGALGLADSAVQQTAFSMTNADIVVPIYQTGGGGGGGGDVQPIIGDVEEPPPADDGTRRIFDMTFQKQEAGSVLRLLAYMNFASNDDLKLTAAILVDGITRQVCEINLGLDNANSKARAPMTIPAFLTGVPAGPHRVELIVRNFETDTALTVRAGATIEITEIKRGAL